MTESNLERDLITLHQTAVAEEFQHILIIVGNDKDRINRLKQISTNHNLTVNFSVHLFDNVDDCENFVQTDLHEDTRAQCVVLISSQLANELIPCIVHSERITEIHIMDELSASQEERESLKQYPKVKFSKDDTTAQIASHVGQTPDREITQEDRFSESVDITSMKTDGLSEDIISDAEANERSTGCFFSPNAIFRYFVLRFLLEVPSMPLDMDNLIDLFRMEFLVSEKSIHAFQETYKADRAIQFYTEKAYIFEGLNKALRSLNIDHLLRYRFVLKDIHAQLKALMTNELDTQSRKVYRGQKMNFVELWSLFNSFKQRAPVVVNSFFSTSLDRKQAIGFLHSGTENQQLNMKNICVLFTIHIRQEQASSDWPFADISIISKMHGEEEVLFAPNQMFIIDKFEVIPENGSYNYSVEMSFFNDPRLNFNMHYNLAKIQWKTHTDNPLVQFARLLLTWKRYQESKKIIEQVLKDIPDDQTKIACYKALGEIAMFTNNCDEAAEYQQKVMELKFGRQITSTLPDDILLPPEFHRSFGTFFSQIQNFHSQIPLDRPLHEVKNYLESNEVNNIIQQAPQMTFMLAKALISQQQYQLAISVLEPALMMSRLVAQPHFDPSRKSKFSQAIADCYRHLNLNEKALEYYTLALDGNITLPLEQHIEILYGTGKALVAMNQWETALENFIQAAEIYQAELPNADPDDVVKIEECIQQVTSHILSSNE